MKTPAVTIVIPTYNRAAFLRATLATALGQSVQDFELIVVDDGSTDETAQILQDMAGKDARIQVVRNEGPHGPGAARNAGIARARADWIAFLDSDDQWEPDKLEQFLAVAQPGVAMVGSDYRIVDRERREQRTMRGFIFETMVPWWEKDPLARRVIDCARLRADIQALTDPKIMTGMAIGGFLWPQTSSVMARRADLEDAGGFDTNLPRTEDMVLWFKLMRRGRVAYVDRALARYDITGRDLGGGDRYETQERTRRHNAYVEAHYHLRFLKSLPGRATLDGPALAFLSERIAAQHRRCGHAARGPLSIGHYAAALLRSAEQRRLIRHDLRGYFARPF